MESDFFDELIERGMRTIHRNKATAFFRHLLAEDFGPEFAAMLEQTVETLLDWEIQDKAQTLRAAATFIGLYGLCHDIDNVNIGPMQTSLFLLGTRSESYSDDVAPDGDEHKEKSRNHAEMFLRVCHDRLLQIIEDPARNFCDCENCKKRREEKGESESQ